MPLWSAHSVGGVIVLASSFALLGQGAFTFCNPQFTALVGGGVAGGIATGETNPSAISGLFVRLENSSIPSNAFIGSWTDSVSSVVYSQADDDLKPSNSSAGLYFSGDYLQDGASTTISIDYTIWIACKPSGNLDSWGLVFGSSVNGYGLQMYNRKFYAYGSGPNLISGVVSNELADVGYTMSNGEVQGYTNGLAGPSDIYSRVSHMIDAIGYDSSAEAYDGWIYEICVWTNRLLTAGEFSGLHVYRTNKYGL